MADIIQWLATIAGIVAAVMVAGRFSARMTGWGFVIFAVSSIGWITFGIMKDEPPLTLQNVVLLGVNIVGVWRHLLSKEDDKKAA